MALINCPECGKEVSTSASTCPHCGFPMAGQPVAKPAAVSNELLMEVRPSWWHFFWYLCFFWLIVPAIVAWWQRSSIVLRIYPGRLMLSRGMFSTCDREFMARDIRALDIDQSLLGRLVGIGTLTISTSATVDADEKIAGIPNPHAIRDLILEQRGGQ
jgi:uncharacterized membrane protein YdbT with pleckstrin-like domain